MRAVLKLAVMFAGLAVVTACQAQAWPTKPIRLVHGFGAGSAVDISARIMTAPMAEMLGQQFVVDPRPGVGGTMAARIVAKAEPDGYTQYLMISGHVVAASLYRKLPYDTVRDFAAIALMASTPFVIAVAEPGPIRTIADLVRVAREQPGKLDYATGGIGTGTHLAAALMQSRLGVQFNHVPYRGGNTALALTSGEVQLIVGTPAGVMGFASAGRIRLLAVTTAKRLPVWPEVPTVGETVLPNFEASGWFMLAAPRGLPPAIAARMHEATVAALRRPEVVERLLATGTVVTLAPPRDAAAFLAGETARWAKVVRDESIPPQD